ncbi:hypothetical protein C8R46DRAFT_1025328 [Mycena filopes]|nr:hypothetical protein C8R46DRAFT_1025328 [Mycena filopes]
MDELLHLRHCCRPPQFPLPPLHCSPPPLAPLQQASSSQAPPPRPLRPSAAGSSSQTTEVLRLSVADVSAEEEATPLAVFFAGLQDFSPETALREVASISSFLSQQPSKHRAQFKFLDQISSIFNIVGEELDLEMPLLDRKGKGNARE